MCGYKTIFTQNLFLIALIAATLLTLLLSSALLDLVCKRTEGRKITLWVSNFSTRFLYEFFFEIFLCVLIHSVTLSSAGDSLWAFSVAILTLLGLFVAFIVSRFFTGGPYVKNSYARGGCCPLWYPWWGKRHLSQETMQRFNSDTTPTLKSQSTIVKQACDDDENEVHTSRHLLEIEQQAPVNFSRKFSVEVEKNLI